MSVKVSVVVALYDKEKYIEKCLKSLINQSLENIEIVVVNDCSTDSSLELVKNIKDDRIIVVNNRVNKGIGYSRNKGITKCTGKYICFVDADDYIETKMLEDYYNFMEINDLDMLNSDYYKIINNEKTLFKVPAFSTTNIYDNVNIINLINYGPCNKMFRKKLIVDNDIKFSEKTKFEDFIFVANVISLSERIGYLSKAYYNYVIHDNSETTTVDERTFDIFKVMNEVNSVYAKLKDSEELVYLNIVEITRYMLKQKYQINPSLKKEFIKEGYEYLKSINNKWRKNIYYKNESKLKRIIKNNKTFMIIYCKM